MAANFGTSLQQGNIESFHEHLLKSQRIVALLGAGLSASSGLPTFRGAGGLWRTHESTSLATPWAFSRDPGLVWQFYSYRRHMALSVQPNPAHYALAELSRKMPSFMTLSQNVDGLSQRAAHPPNQLKLLHGTLFAVSCFNKCGYSEPNFVDPIVPALALPSEGIDPTTNEARAQVAQQGGAAQSNFTPDISDANVPIPALSPRDLPQCPQCKTSLLRPGVVWFGESLPSDVLAQIDEFFEDEAGIDLMMVIGTSARVWPAAGYISEAADKGARVCVINMEPRDDSMEDEFEPDWYFEGDAAQLVPELLRPIIGEVALPSST